MKLTLLALSYFQKTAELQHLTKAAEALHISQPSLSHTIKVLETELGVPLFSRSGRNIVLTRYGEILLRHTNRIMQELNGAQKELADTKEAQKLTVTISLFAASMIRLSSPVSVRNIRISASKSCSSITSRARRIRRTSTSLFLLRSIRSRMTILSLS